MKHGSALFSALAVTVALSAGSSAHADQIYSWRDASGRVHYSDLPPPASVAKVKAKDVGGGAPATDAAAPGTTDKTTDKSAAPAKAKTLADKELEFKKRQVDNATAKAKAEKEQTAAEQKRRDCERAKSHLTDLESGRRMAITNADGERGFMEDDQRAQELQDTRRAISSVCK